MLRDGYEPGMGLGRNSDGTVGLVKFAENHERFGLGCEPMNADKRRISLKRKERSLASLQGWGLMCHHFLLFLNPFCHHFNY